MINIYIHVLLTNNVQVQSSLQSSGKGMSWITLSWEGRGLAEDEAGGKETGLTVGEEPLGL